MASKIATVEVSNDGRCTIPVEVRRALGIVPEGDIKTVEVEVRTEIGGAVHTESERPCEPGEHRWVPDHQLTPSGDWMYRCTVCGEMEREP